MTFLKVKYFLVCGDFISFVIDSVRQITITSVHVVARNAKTKFVARWDVHVNHPQNSQI